MSSSTKGVERFAVYLILDFECLEEHNVITLDLDSDISDSVEGLGLTPVYKLAYEPVVCVGLTAELIPGGSTERRYTKMLDGPDRRYEHVTGPDAVGRLHFSRFGPDIGIPARVLRRRLTGEWKFGRASVSG